MPSTRRRFLQHLAADGLGWGAAAPARAAETSSAAPRDKSAPLTITGLKITPIALPDPPLLAAGGCHGPYFLRNIVELETDAGIVGIGETKGDQSRTEALEQCREIVVGRDAFAWRQFGGALQRVSTAAYAGIELACLDACGRATGLRVCELLGGPVRESVEYAAYLFYRYAADDRRLLADPRVVDSRGQGEQALDRWGEVRTPEAMAELAAAFQRQWGFRVMKLKAGVLPPEVECATLAAISARFRGEAPLRIDPNGRWTVPTSLRIAECLKRLPLEYYEDPVTGQQAMAEVRRASGLPLSTNMCVTRFEHIPSAARLQPVDVILGDHHGWGGLAGFLSLGQICETFGWGLSQHSNNHAGITMAAMTHIGATVPGLTYASDTHYPWLVEGSDIIQGPNLVIAGGRMTVPRGPGLGVELDPDKLARAHETWRKCGMTDRDDAFTMRLIEPGWQRTLF